MCGRQHPAGCTGLGSGLPPAQTGPACSPCPPLAAAGRVRRCAVSSAVPEACGRPIAAPRRGPSVMPGMLRRISRATVTCTRSSTRAPRAARAGPWRTKCSVPPSPPTSCTGTVGPSGSSPWGSPRHCCPAGAWGHMAGVRQRHSYSAKPRAKPAAASSAARLPRIPALPGARVAATPRLVHASALPVLPGRAAAHAEAAPS